MNKKKKKIIVAGTAAVVGVLALSSGAVAAQHYVITSSSQIKDGSIAARDLTPAARKALKGHKGPKGDTGPRGPAGSSVAASPIPGPDGPRGPQGPKGDPGALPAGFATSASATDTGGVVTVTPVTPTTAGLGFGPYADGGTAGGSVIYEAPSGLTLKGLTTLSFTAQYSTDDDTDGGVPYLRVFFADGKDLIYSPNTQPSKVTSENTPHTWDVLAGTVRYDDDAGNGPDMPFAQAVTEHGSDPIVRIKVSAGFSGGKNLKVTLTDLKVQNKAFHFGS